MEKVITDARGNDQKIRHGEKYVVIYRTGKTFKIEHNCYFNYEMDEWIGKDDEEGRAKGPRFYFNEAKIPSYEVKRMIEVIDTETHFKKMIKEMYGF